MSRRDTIIIAVLINACLLVILFATSITKKDEPHFATNQEVPFNVPSQNINFEDVERSLVKETKSIEESFPLHTPLITQNNPEPANLLPPASPKVAPLAPLEQKYTEITVKSGDYLDRLGRENNISVSEIMSYNNLKSTQLRIGQVLRIPLKENEDPSSKLPIKQYVVKVGDTPWKIANENKMHLDELLKLNHLDKESSKHLKPGDTLYIR
ncbi:MAG: hypothetical protein S4CHLAM6_15520 [Chlamydiae bacterium]|nr:hypothetical protein [Chlamydiota bacterium]